MQKTIKLRNPIMIDGKPVSEITHDSNEITAILYAEAEAKKKVAAGAKNAAGFSVAVEFDFALHIYMGFAAAVAVNPSYSFEDLERVRGGDLTEFAEVGRRFLLNSDSSQESNSEKESEPTAEPSTQALPNSNDAE